MSDPNEKKVEDPLDEDAADDLGDEPADEDTTDWKAEARKARGIATRLRTKITKLTEAKKPDAKPAEQQPAKKGFDYAEKAFLKSNGIQKDEYEFVEEVMRSTGKSLDDVLESKYFQSELKEKRDEQASKDAIPTGSRRASSPTRDSVDFWIAKGELPTADQVDLRRKVVNEKIKRAKNGSQFSDNPVVR